MAREKNAVAVDRVREERETREAERKGPSTKPDLMKSE